MYANLETYHTLKNNENMRYGCCLCGRHYALKISLGRHLRIDCGKQPAMPCSFCNSKFKHRYELINHLRQKHQQPIGALRNKKKVDKYDYC